MRGKQYVREIESFASPGSSPRARGTEDAPEVAVVRRGIIPACAGNSQRRWGGACGTGDHPRMRGEQGVYVRNRNLSSGSSPHARGTAGRAGALTGHAGIIPAGAGNRSSMPVWTSSRWDHPRMRGEQMITSELKDSPGGSSPRARGAGVPPAHRHVAEGIIPACAGNSDLQIEVYIAVWDHPRVRGEQYEARVDDKGDLGSSPRARGTADIEARRDVAVGIIPACAGNSRTPWAPAAPRRDHPRVRGEQALLQIKRHVQEGSSPRARGTGGPRYPVEPAARIIPACAGNSIRCTCSACACRDHPRVRGEQADAEGHLVLTQGSSPRARGTDDHVSGLRVLFGIIPACAGNRLPR